MIVTFCDVIFCIIVTFPFHVTDRRPQSKMKVVLGIVTAAVLLLGREISLLNEYGLVALFLWELKSSSQQPSAGSRASVCFLL